MRLFRKVANFRIIQSAACILHSNKFFIASTRSARDEIFAGQTDPEKRESADGKAGSGQPGSGGTKARQMV